MRFSPNQHPFYWGMARHAWRLYGCLLSHDGEVLLHRNRHAAPEPVRKAMAPYRAGLVVAVECRLPWYGRADRCAPEGMAFVLGPALSLKAIPGGTAHKDRRASHTMAGVLRGGMLPQTSGSPAQRRATRARRRRRPPLRRPRAALRAQVHHTPSQDNGPESGKQSAAKANRAGVADRLTEPAVPQSLAGDGARRTEDEQLRNDVALSGVKAAPHPDAPTLAL